MPNDFKGRPRTPGRAFGPRGETAPDLESLDKRLVALLIQRTRLAAAQGSSRRERGGSLVDPEREKRLWATWSRLWQESGMDPRPLRRLFGTVNALGLEQSEATGAAAKSFLLTPRRDPVSVDIPGPRSLRLTRMWTALAAAAGFGGVLSPVVVNDPLLDLVKALNQAGARLSWEEDQLRLTPGQPLDFDDRLIFAGADPLNFHLLLGLALPRLAKAKFVGGPALRFLDLDRMNSLLVPLGARLVPVDPNVPGLPARLESGGRMASRITLTEAASPDLARGLALAAWSYPNGLELAFPQGSALEAALAETAGLLQACGVGVRQDPGVLAVAASTPQRPADWSPPLDPVLGAAFLALPLFHGGQVRLSGPWAGDWPEAANAAALLRAAGLQLETGPQAAVSRPGQVPARGDFPAALFAGPDGPALLALALALALPLRDGAHIGLPGDGSLADQAEAFLEAVGKPYRLEGGDLEVLAGPPRRGVEAPAWYAPTPWHALALALAALHVPGQQLANPGEMTGLWPKFFLLYNSLPSIQGLPAKKEPKVHEPAKRVRRVRVS